jgi:putative membrane protein
MTSRILLSAGALALALGAAACKPANQTGNAAGNAAGTAAETTGNAATSATEAVKNAAASMSIGTPSASEFVAKAAQANMLEIDSSKLAAERSKNPDIKKFAQQMVKDHTKLGDELKATAQKAGFTEPTAPDSDMQRKLDDLKNASALDFDKKYVDLQGKAHDDAVNLFKTYAEKGDNTELKAVAAKALPQLQKHADEVKTLEKADSGQAGPATGAPEQK